MAMVTTLFFMWGFVTSLNDVLIPHLKDIFGLSYAGAMLVQVFFFFGYFVFALPAGKLVEVIGYKKTMVTGLIVMAVGALIFIPAASVPSYPIFLVALMVLAAGMTALQVSANPYVSVLGPPQTASSRLNLTQAFNSLGTTIAPYLGGLLILRSVVTGNQFKALSAEKVSALSGSSLSTYMSNLQQYRIDMAAKVKLPYLGIAGTLILLALVVAIYKLPRIEATRDFRPQDLGQKDSMFNYPHLLMGAVAIFVYVGAEVSIGSFLVNYFTSPVIGISTAETAAKIVSLYWLGAMIGRFIGSAILQRLDTGKVLGIAAVVAALLVCTSMLSVGTMAMVSIILVGLFNSIMFPSIFTLAIAELGPLTGEGSGLLVAAIVGGAIIPWIQGVLADKVGIHHAFVLPVICYLYIVYYGFKGSRPIRRVRA
jgi:MFS transporter, FHS family, L-fucose permease